MGDRYFLTVTCPKCGQIEHEVYYAPTCDIIEHKCICGGVIDLEELSGISYGDASNLAEVEEMVKRVSKKYKTETGEVSNG